MLHATLIELAGVGILLTGKSGSGKSDLALRLIENKGAVLVADDVVEVECAGGKIYGCAPTAIAGMLEVRGIGIVKYPYYKRAEVRLVIHLVDKSEDVERMPKVHTVTILGLEIKQIDLYAKENSAPDKVMAAARLFVDGFREIQKKC